MTIIDATYSPEDNKLRLYASSRLDAETYQRVKAAGFKWAPKQELFVAPMWTPAREDLCVELAGEITAEQTTLVERAEAKAERLDDLAARRGREANSYHQAASRIAERFAFGQPILVGHHSERKARKDQERMHQAMTRAVQAQEAVSYWNYRAEGVERHANRKANPAVRARRIKTLLSELRDWQRRINHANLCLEVWRSVEVKAGTEEFAGLVSHYAGAHLRHGGAFAPYQKSRSLWSQLQDGEVTAPEVVAICLRHHEYQANSPYTLRWISHILNRLDYERGELGPVARFEGELTPVVLQAFCRAHGADKPTAAKSETGFCVASPLPLPLHIADGKELELTEDGWRDLMVSVGYEVPVPAERRTSARRQAPLVNPTQEEAERLQAIWNRQALERRPTITPREVRAVEQAHFSANSKGDYSPYSTISLDADGNKIWPHRSKSPEPVCRVRVFDGGGSLYSPEALVTLTDKPTKPLPIAWPVVASEEVA